MKRNRLSVASIAFFGLATVAFSPGSATAQSTFTDVSISNGLIAGTSASSGGIELRLGGLIIGKGLYSGVQTLTTSDQGAGTRLLWYPQKAAFRAGSVSFNQWDDANIGKYSIALGRDTTAKGESSIALGQQSGAFGVQSTAIGHTSVAHGVKSTALGSGNAAGERSIAIGYDSVALGYVAFASGYSTTAVRGCSTSMGYWTTASGNISTALGDQSLASGDRSTAMGYGTTASSYGSTAIGIYNIGGGTDDNYIPADPLFEIGNGTPPNYENEEPIPEVRSNALTVYKNGNMDVQGVVTCAPGGDIPMFTGN